MCSYQLQEKGWVNKMSKNFNAYKGMTVRNIKVYLKDKMAIVLSMMAQIIVLGLYLLFLKSTYIDGIKSSLDGLQNMVTNTQIDAVVNAWLVAGVIGTSVVTVALNSLSVMVNDKQNKINYDYGASPVKNRTVVLSYFSGAVVNTFLMSALLLTAGFVFLAISSSLTYSFVEIISMYGLVALGSISATLILMLIVSFFKKSSTLSSFGILVSAGIGFIIGAYIPVSQFDKSIQTVVNLVPGSQIAGMMRNVLMAPSIDSINTSLGGVDNGVLADSLNDMFALDMNVFSNEVGFKFMMLYSLCAIALFLVLNLIAYRFTSKIKD